MTFPEATKLRDKYKPLLVGKPYKLGVRIRDIIVSDNDQVSHVYSMMYDNDLDNDSVLKSVGYNLDKVDVFIIGHEWFQGNGDFHYQPLQSYLKDFSL